jgi:hypothetical protein
MLFADCTAAVALDKAAAEKSMGSIVLSSKAKRIVGVWSQILGGALLTTAEAVSGIFRLQSDSVDMSPSKWPTDQESMLTGGSAQLPTHIIPVDIPVTGLAQINTYITLDDVITGDLKGRVGIIYEG